MRFARPSLVMQAFHVLPLILMVPVASASTAFQPLDRVEGWLIERRLDDSQDPICRASVPGPGTWFSARVHLDQDDEMVVPAGLHRPDETGLKAVRDALQRCRASVLYL
ncbi:hypothetical protein SynA1562_01116 [Synechococcus sp. A15-62]|uniref:hypothetical protein n=1 Tax=Synechococcus sp. A15-62 TaxID=1050657 RepID=UPI0018627269|nr:hypothetical protein [Synechococcus sp. A15-62]QNI99950.1 hypothetical protein SynA1562_01116 [Synechococcus sp. A15-62]